ncbi:hypothetical protein GCM10009565_18040 [Amycolatopsis albidoflavus]
MRGPLRESESLRGSPRTAAGGFDWCRAGSHLRVELLAAFDEVAYYFRAGVGVA